MLEFTIILSENKASLLVARTAFISMFTSDAFWRWWRRHQGELRQIKVGICMKKNHFIMTACVCTSIMSDILHLISYLLDERRVGGAAVPAWNQLQSPQPPLDVTI